MAVITIVISSLGNRPQGSKWIYISCIWLFMVIMAALLYLGGYQIYQFSIIASRAVSAQGTLMENVRALFGIPGFVSIFVAFLSTYGLYVFQSLLYFDPWHMITSSFQYLLFLPSYVNILNVYACKFLNCNY